MSQISTSLDAFILILTIHSHTFHVKQQSNINKQKKTSISSESLRKKFRFRMYRIQQLVREKEREKESMHVNSDMTMNMICVCARINHDIVKEQKCFLNKKKNKTNPNQDNSILMYNSVMPGITIRFSDVSSLQKLIRPTNIILHQRNFEHAHLTTL